MVKKFASILLAIFFLVSSSHLSFATHFCGGKAFKHALLFTTSELGCGMENGTDDCDKTSIVKKDCCHNESFLINIEDDFQQLTSSVSFEHQGFIFIATTLFMDIVTNEVTLFSYQNYKPPIPDKDIPVLIQSFLI